MALSAHEVRVLACLIEGGATAGSDAHLMTLDAIRLACNQSDNRDRVVTYDDRTVDRALLSLKSMGLVRFVAPPQGGRVTRYRHTADERWKLSPIELEALAAIVLGGPQSAAQLRDGALRSHADEGTLVDDALDTLASRRPEPFAVRLDERTGERGVRFAQLLTAEAEDTESVEQHGADGPGEDDAPPGFDLPGLAAEVAFLRARVGRLERELGVTGDSADRTDDA